MTDPTTELKREMVQAHDRVVESLQSTELVDPQTGELVNAADLQQAGVYLDILRRRKREIDDQIKLVEAIALNEMALLGQGTVRKGRVQLTRQGGKKYEYDLEELAKLQDAGLPEDRYSEVVKPVVDWKVDRNALKQLSAANPEYRQIIENATTEVEGRTWLRVDFQRGEA